MKEPMGLAARVEILRELLSKEGSLKTSEIRIYFASLGVSDKCIMHTTHHAYKYGITHRRKNRGTNGYEYRLASKYPRWGTRYEAEEQAARRNVVTTCKRKSQVYQLDQLLKSARGGHAPQEISL
ncbi:hypothetical protein EKL29_08100 [Pantoea sp. YU22]|uniref:hypothetical protein n=1 Tax=Pantoea sp. YU22 TaxID=2497684 RepID=UPI000F894E28|nr:hypothetical protein [Pantoea sp. YU22]RTY58784.1 hypothetical protein EKL29_08100 [Pantoea sp. YU22]